METRTEYVEKLSAQMVEMDNRIDLLKDKAESATPETSGDYTGLIRTLQIKRDQVAAKLQGISVAGDHEWEEMRSGTELVWGEVRSMLHDTITKIR